MACGLPVIVSREAGASELIDHGRDGLLLTDHRDVAELGRHMNDLCTKRDWAERLGASARQTAERYSWDTVGQQTMRVYQDVVALRNGSRELCHSRTV
jgi:glycosyltransferase EpsD